MFRFSKKRVFFITLSFLIFFEIIFLLTIPIFKTQENESNEPLNRKEIREKIISDGADNVFLELKAKYKNASVSQAHLAMHIFGELLYETKSAEGIAFCDHSFGFACFHGFFLSAIAFEGLEILKTADRICVEKYGVKGIGCQHGIGHGLYEYYGFDEIDKALDACKTLSWNKELLGCRDGVFMEYNFRNDVSDDQASVVIRKMSDDIYSPCESVNEESRPSCYYNLPQWWIEQGMDFAKIGEYCNINIQKYRTSCYLGLGYIVPFYTNYNLSKINEACGEMIESESKSLCLAGASWAFFIDKNRDESIALCAYADDLDLCLKEWDLFQTL